MTETQLPPDAAARDAAKRGDVGEADDALNDDEFFFVTRHVTHEERAAVIAVLTAVRTEESQQVKRVTRRVRQPWARTQRPPERISDFLPAG